jgi:transcriptional regulator with XRE-family HTH domain
MEMEFWEWMTQKYIDWRGNAVGHERTISEFAKKLGVSQSLMSQWMKRGGKVPNSAKHINSLIEEYGSEVYDVLGLPRPKEKSTDEKYEELLSILDELTDDRREDVLRYARSVLGGNEKSSTERKTKPRTGTASA